MPTQLTAREVALLRAEILKEATSRPPTVGLIGVSGVGKSSTINALFKTQLPISHTVACTKEFTEVKLSLRLQEGHGKDLPVALRVFDAPGLGEDVQRDPDYLRRYEQLLPNCDVILWISAARNRAVALEQQYLNRLSKFRNKLVFAISQVDLTDPGDWRTNVNLPSKDQLRHIDEICIDRGKRFAAVLRRELRFIPFSATYRFNLEELFGEIIDACHEKRRWLLSGLKGFHYADFLPLEIRKQLRTGDEFEE